MLAAIAPVVGALMMDGEQAASNLFTIDWSPIQTGIKDAFTTAVPIGIGVMVVFLGIRYVPRIIKSIGH